MTRKPIDKDSRLTSTVDSMVAAFVRTVSTTPKASTATNVNRNSIGRMGSNGTRRMCANVRNSSESAINHFSRKSIRISACNCETFFSTGNCEEETGRCECRKEFQEPDCQTCSYGHFGYPDCRPCECNLIGTDGYQCQSENGSCSCKPNFAGHFCNRCADGFYGPDCLPCDCDLTGSLNDVCDFETGQCPCSSQYDGKQCERCKDGYYNYPSCPCE